jgi:peptidoglycan/LPS O-acetylase OafA/YrhL
MWNTNSLWFEVSIVTCFFLLGNIFLGHFEERSPKLRKLFKYLLTLAIILILSIYLGRTVALLVLGLSLLPIIYIHGVVLPRKGINGWTAEPKSKYYDFRGWDKNIFGQESTYKETPSKAQD